ncbi:MAG: pre-peptidase C-terminal domain-containing protein [Deltaproteobacteria bacterium]|nr:pre-peptidase C-terminal domain-containing protein [Deltaproteobacteria bacterium]
MTSLTCLATTVACGGGGAPELSGLSDQVAQVGAELKVDLNGTDPDGDQLTYGFKAADLDDLSDRAQVSVSPSGNGVFRWTPVASDVGEHAFDFTVSDGDNNTTVTITIDVKSAIGSATAPVFRQPLGSGTTIDLAKKKCVDLSIVIEDQDTAQVNLTMEEPIIEGASLNQQDGLTANFQWCPTKEQEAETRYTLVIGADDGENPKTLKNYLIVLRSGATAACPGTAPTIAHTVSNENTIVGLTVDATFTDDKGLKEAPLFYYSLTAPPTPPVLSQMIQLSTIKISGTNKNGVYAADVPNPVASSPAGTAKKIYYLFVADDDDDITGNCDHSTTSQVYNMTVTSSGSANLPICAACTSDSQCGTGDLCVYTGSMGDSYCMQGCAGGCPSGFACSATKLYSVDYKQEFQCVPQSGSCQAPTGTCADDANEDDDSRSAASANALVDGPLAPGIHDFVSCPKTGTVTYGSQSDDDWFQIKTTADTKLDLWLYGNGESDLDLQLYRSDGTILSKSTSLTADENIIKCVKAGTYYIKVNGFDRVRSEYLLDQLTTAQTCNTTCVDDAREDDDTYSQARSTIMPFTSTANVTCPNDDDWYKVRLTTGKKLTIDLTFTQSNSTQDLDVHLYKGFTDLWPCDVNDPSQCTSTRGQSATSNEHAEYTAPAGCEAGCDYYVVVRGYNGSTNNYGIALKVL